MKDIAGLKANTTTAPYATTEPAKIGGVRGGGVSPNPTPQGVIFQESFDDLDDWHSGLPENDQGGLKVTGGTVDIVQRKDTHTIPDGWDVVRQAPAWAPSTGHPDRNEVIEILAANSDKARGGTGKSFVSWRDSDTSNGDNYWNSDGILAKHFPEGLTEVYCEFWITFSNEMIATYYSQEYKDESTGNGKLFRIYHWNPEVNGEFDFFGGNNNPHFTWGFSGRPTENNGYGFRNSLSFLTRRDGASEGKYLDGSGNPATSEPSSYISDIETPGTVPDVKNGGLIDSGVAGIDQVFGDESHWTKMAFYIKLNSAPGVFDGIFKQWIDDHRIQNINTVNWVESGRDMVPFTVIGIGGNDWFNKYPNDQRVNEWYAIDDLVIRDSIPDGLEI